MGDDTEMRVERTGKRSAVAPLLLGLLLAGAAVILSAVSGIIAWDPEETCRVRGSYLSAEQFFGTTLCSDGTAVQPMWMTVSTAVLLVAAVICITIGIICRARRRIEQDPPPATSHWS